VPSDGRGSSSSKQQAAVILQHLSGVSPACLVLLSVACSPSLFVVLGTPCSTRLTAVQLYNKHLMILELLHAMIPVYSCTYSCQSPVSCCVMLDRVMLLCRFPARLCCAALSRVALPGSGVPSAASWHSRQQPTQTGELWPSTGTEHWLAVLWRVMR